VHPGLLLGLPLLHAHLRNVGWLLRSRGSLRPTIDDWRWSRSLLALALFLWLLDRLRLCLRCIHLRTTWFRANGCPLLLLRLLWSRLLIIALLLSTLLGSLPISRVIVTVLLLLLRCSLTMRHWLAGLVVVVVLW